MAFSFPSLFLFLSNRALSSYGDERAYLSARGSLVSHTFSIKAELGKICALFLFLDLRFIIKINIISA
jgi:hypothetical protein